MVGELGTRPNSSPGAGPELVSTTVAVPPLPPTAPKSSTSVPSSAKLAPPNSKGGALVEGGNGLELQPETAVPAQVPDWQLSVCVQALPSLQAVPLGATGFEHAPVAGLQVPERWHGSLAVQVTRFVPAQVPDWQLSVCVQALPSLQAVPLGATGFEQPVAGLQVPARWHWSLAAQVTGFVPEQMPAWQMSVWVHALPSLHVPPVVGAQVPTAPGVLQAWHCPQDGAAVLQHTPSTHMPAAHWLVERQGPPKPGVTSTLNVTRDWLLAASAAAHVTVWWPTANTLPDGGVQVTG